MPHIHRGARTRHTRLELRKSQRKTLEVGRHSEHDERLKPEGGARTCAQETRYPRLEFGGLLSLTASHQRSVNRRGPHSYEFCTTWLASVRHASWLDPLSLLACESSFDPWVKSRLGYERPRTTGRRTRCNERPRWRVGATRSLPPPGYAEWTTRSGPVGNVLSPCDVPLGTDPRLSLGV